MRRLLLPLVLLVATAVLVGCGSDADERPEPTTRRTERPSATTDPSALPTACALLPEADVVEAFGEPVAAGTQGTDECWWSTANDLKTVNLIRRTEDLATWRSGYDNDFWTPNDFGDEGYTGRALTSIVWREGDVQYEVNVVYSTRGNPERVVQDLATRVAARL